MDQNPYAPPTSEYIPSGVAGVGVPQHWDIGEVLQLGWDITKQHWPLLVTAMLISWFAPQAIVQVPSTAQLLGLIDPDPTVEALIAGGSFFIGLLSNAFFLPGQLRIYLALSRGQSAELGLLFSGADCFFPILGVSILSWFGIMFGWMLCLVPGFILLVSWWFAQYFVVDQKLGPIDAMKASWNLTSGQRVNIFVLGLLSVLLYFFGVSLCCVGALVTLPMCFLASTIVYLRSTGQMSRNGPVAPSELSTSPPSGPMGAGPFGT